MKNRLKPLNSVQVRLQDNFWAPRERVNRRATLVTQYKLLKSTGRLDAFNPKVREVHLFWDSDVAKWLEAAAYSLAVAPDALLERRVRRAVRDYVRGQLPDGYLNSFYQRTGLDKRWTNLRDMHELYNAGHLIEAAVALAEANGQRDLLQALCRCADHIACTFGTGKGQKRGYPGHPELELALMRLYRATGEKRYLDLASYFVDERGREPHYFNVEAVARGEKPQKPSASGWRFDYCQAHLPVREQKSAEGHAVRACYLYAGMADVAAERGDRALLAACRRLWKSITVKRMYITGGVGSTPVGERFTIDYDLPDESGYAETCAAIGLVFFAQRMVNIELDSDYADVMERALYNGVAAGVSLDGRKFFYANRLAVYPRLTERFGGGQNNFPTSRQEWFDCSCCPPNIARLYASLGSYVASGSGDRLALHLYAAGTVSAALSGGSMKLAVGGDYPWDGRVGVRVEAAPAKQAVAICLRLPGWCRAPSATLNGEKLDLARGVRKGYLIIRRVWSAGDTIALDFPMEVERMAAHPAVRHAAGRVALQRGPLVYCLEECDNGADLAAIELPRGAVFTTRRSSMLGGIVTIQAPAWRLSARGWEKSLYRPAGVQARTRCTLKAVPYSLWNNRKSGEMRVFVRECE